MPTPLIDELAAIDRFLAQIAKDGGIAYDSIRQFSQGLQPGGGFDPAVLAKGLTGFKILTTDLAAATSQMRQMGIVADEVLSKVQRRLEQLATSQHPGSMFSSYIKGFRPAANQGPIESTVQATLPTFVKAVNLSTANTSLVTSLQLRVQQGEAAVRQVEALVNATKQGIGPFAGTSRTVSSLSAERRAVLASIGVTDAHRGPALGTSVQSRLAYYTSPPGEIYEGGVKGTIAARETAIMRQRMEIERNRLTGMPGAVQPYYGP
jgi:hypothetical protein